MKCWSINIYLVLREENLIFFHFLRRGMKDRSGGMSFLTPVVGLSLWALLLKLGLKLARLGDCYKLY